jgi:hypothetical protein
VSAAVKMGEIVDDLCIVERGKNFTPHYAFLADWLQTCDPARILLGFVDKFATGNSETEVLDGTNDSFAYFFRPNGSGRGYVTEMRKTHEPSETWINIMRRTELQFRQKWQLLLAESFALWTEATGNAMEVPLIFYDAAAEEMQRLAKQRATDAKRLADQQAAESKRAAEKAAADAAAARKKQLADEAAAKEAADRREYEQRQARQAVWDWLAPNRTARDASVNAHVRADVRRKRLVLMARVEQDRAEKAKVAALDDRQCCGPVTARVINTEWIKSEHLRLSPNDEAIIDNWIMCSPAVDFGALRKIVDDATSIFGPAIHKNELLSRMTDFFMSRSSAVRERANDLGGNTNA